MYRHIDYTLDRILGDSMCIQIKRKGQACKREGIMSNVLKSVTQEKKNCLHPPPHAWCPKKAPLKKAFCASPCGCHARHSGASRGRGNFFVDSNGSLSELVLHQIYKQCENKDVAKRDMHYN